jgi:23S rRNA pseudoU1915 N3-methylase RlmH
VGRIVVYLYGKPKEKSYLNIINEYYKRLKGRGISLSYYSDKNKYIDYENMLLNLKGNLIIIDENGEELSSKALSILISKIILDHTTTNFAL